MMVNSTVAHHRIFPPPPSSSHPTEQESSRRLQVARLIHSLWTDGGSDLSGIAPPLLDGRIDLLGAYITWKHIDDFNYSNNNGDDENDLLGYSACHQHKENVNRENPLVENNENEHATTYSMSRRAIDRVHCDNLPYQQFTDLYMCPNQPVIIQGLTRDWKAPKHWVVEESNKDDDDGNIKKLVPNLKYIQETFGSDIVPVHEQNKHGLFGLQSRPVTREMTVSEYADWWHVHHQVHQKQRQQRSGDIDIKDEKDDDHSTERCLLYLKDWKFVAAHPSYNAYQWPIYFQDDWLNQAMGNAYKFVYLGPAGTSTILHADVLRSYSWSTNVCGRKRWYLIPPQYTYLLYDCFGKTLASHLHADNDDGLENNGSSSNSSAMQAIFPGLQEARRHAICVEQEPGETIFVPSKWYHTVENLDDTLSINHNWLNGNNVGYCWEKLKAEVMASRPLLESDGYTSQQTTSNDKEIRLETDKKDNSQVADDLELLWHVLTRKANVLLSSSSNQNAELSSPVVTADLETIRVILSDLLQLCQDRAPELLSRRDDFNIEKLMNDIAQVCCSPKQVPMGLS